MKLLGMHEEHLDIRLDEILEAATHCGVTEQAICGVLERWLGLARTGFFNLESETVREPDEEHGWVECEYLRRSPLTESGRAFLEKLIVLRRSEAANGFIHEGRQ